MIWNPLEIFLICGRFLEFSRICGRFLEFSRICGRFRLEFRPFCGRLAWSFDRFAVASRPCYIFHKRPRPLVPYFTSDCDSFHKTSI